MKEIGGYLELDQLINKPYYNDMIELNSGRNALAYLIQTKNIKKIYIPYYLCTSISSILDRLSVDYEGYFIDRQFKPLFDKKLKSGEYIFLVNYYGQINNSTIESFKEKYERVIVDNTQAFFQNPVQGVDTLYSLRKYFGLPDGAYLSSDMTIDKKLETEKSSYRMKHILGRSEGKASSYYSDFRENDDSFKKSSLKKMSNLSKNILGAIDYKKVHIRRNENFLYLQSNLGSSNAIDIKVTEGPFAYPYYVKNGIKVRKTLVEKNIYVPTLWPNILKDVEEKTIEYDFAANILPLPCDQRYNVQDMERIIKELKICIG